MLGAWELIVTRLASVFYFYDIAYLVLSICLYALGLGALLARRFGERIKLRTIIIAIPFTMLPVWWIVSRYDLAWILGSFTIPFALFGFASTQAWHRLSGSGLAASLYAGELFGTVAGLVLLGPLLIPVLPVDVFKGPGFDTHLRDIVAREGVREARSLATAYARTDLLRTNRDAVVYLFTDAMFVTRAVEWDGKSTQFNDSHVENLARLKRFAMSAAATNEVLILGAGAGFDMAVALQTGARSIDAVEVNENTIRLARTLGVWSGGIFDNSRVNVIIDEARRYISSSTNRWDQISLTLLQTSPAAGRGRSHVDGRVLTLEALNVYLAHLKVEGVISVIQNSRLLADRTYQAMLESADGDASRVLEFRLPIAEHNVNPFSHLLLLRRESFNAEDIDRLEAMAASMGILRHLTIASESAGISPATDDRPFLFESGFRTRAFVLLALLLALISLAVVLYKGRRIPGHIICGASAALVGALTLALQVLVVYRFQSALGNPALSLGLSLAMVLGGAGLGAMLLNRRIDSDWRRSGLLALAGTALFVLMDTTIVSLCLGLEPIAAGLLISGFTFICALPFGLPFLAVMESCRRMPGTGEGLAIACDGLGGIIGAALATGIAMQVGFSAVSILLLVGFILFTIIRLRLPLGVID